MITLNPSTHCAMCSGTRVSQSGALGWSGRIKHSELDPCKPAPTRAATCLVQWDTPSTHAPCHATHRQGRMPHASVPIGCGTIGMDPWLQLNLPQQSFPISIASAKPPISPANITTGYLNKKTIEAPLASRKPLEITTRSSNRRINTMADAATAAAAKLPQRRQSSPLKNGYLIAYNFVSAVAWATVLGRTVALFALRGPHFVHLGVGDWTRWTQTMAAMEVLHALLGSLELSYTSHSSTLPPILHKPDERESSRGKKH